MENVRYNISPCLQGEVAEFIEKIDTGLFVPNGTVKATEKSHYDRYSFLADDSRVALVYDTTANILSITGRSDHAKMLLDLFSPQAKTVKSSTVPSQGTVPIKNLVKRTPAADVKSFGDSSMRAKLFVSPESIKRRSEFAPVPTLFVSSKGAVISTDEIYPPQTSKKRTERINTPVRERVDGFDDPNVIYPPQIVKKRPLPSYGESKVVNGIGNKGYESPSAYAGRNALDTVSQPHMPPPDRGFVKMPIRTDKQQTEHGSDNDRSAGISISVGSRSAGAPRKAVISFGTEDDGKTVGAEFKINTRTQNGYGDAPSPEKRKRGRPPKEKPPVEQTVPPEKRKRGRPPKIQKAQNDYVSGAENVAEKSAPEYKNGYSVKNFTPDALNGAVKRLRAHGKNVTAEGTDFSGTPQEIKNFTVTDGAGQKVLLRYATKRMTLQLQGKRSELFGEVMSQVSYDTDYSSALENYVNTDANGKTETKVSDVQNKLKKRLPNAFEFLSEQSRIDFSYGIHDFGQSDLRLSDYSVLLVPAFRGLERFVFDLQSAEGIKVKMIGQAFDKDDSGRYILKSGYTQRIGSVIYAEVLVSLYTEYFSQRNFFAHSDNTDSNVSRSIPDRATAKRIFDNLLNTVEYNARKLKEIGFSMSK